MFPTPLSRRALLAAGGAVVAGLLGFRSRSVEAVGAGDYCLDGTEWQMAKLINDYRAANGLAPLRMSHTLAAAAEHHSRDMAKYNYFSHTLRNGTSWNANIINHGYTFNTWKGENIAAGHSGPGTTFNQWKNSAPHRANMLSSRFTAIGIGRASSTTSRYGNYWTTTFGGVRTSIPC